MSGTKKSYRVEHHKQYRIDLFEECRTSARDCKFGHEENYRTLGAPLASISRPLLRFIERMQGTCIKLDAGMVYYLSSKSFWEFLIYKSSDNGEINLKNIISPLTAFPKLHEAVQETEYKKPIIMLFTGNVVVNEEEPLGEGTRYAFEFLIEDKLVYLPALNIFRSIYSYYELLVNFIIVGEYSSESEEIWPEYKKYSLNFVR